MTCDWVPKLDGYVDGELSGGELTQVEAHLQACPTCAAVGDLLQPAKSDATASALERRSEFNKR